MKMTVQAKKAGLSKIPKKIKTKDVKKSPAETPTTTLALGASVEKTLKLSQVLPHLKTVTLLAEKRKKEAAGSKDLLEEIEGERVNLQITGIKLPKDGRQQLIKIVVPHRASGPEPETVLFVKDLEKGTKPDHEPTVVHFRELLEAKGVSGKINRIISLRELKVEYKTYQRKIALCHAFSAFLADDRILRLLSNVLGKAFIKRKRFPVGVNLKAQDLPAELDKGLRTVILPVNNRGACSMLRVGHTSMPLERIAENILTVSSALDDKYPGGWKNIRSLYVKSEKSAAIPIHVSTASVKDIGFVDAKIPQRIKQKAVEDELSTLPGATVVVKPFGEVVVKRSDDPNWNDRYEEPFISGSEDEEELEQAAKKKAEKKSKSKDRKKDKKDEKSSKHEKKSKKEEKKNPKKRSREDDEEEEDSRTKKSKNDSDDSEDSDDEMDKAELDFMKKIAKEEEEMERKENSKKCDDQQEPADVLKDVDDDEDSEEEEDSGVDALVFKPDQTQSDDDEEEESKPKMKKKSKKEKRQALKLAKQKSSSKLQKGKNTDKPSQKKVKKNKK